MMNKIGRLAMLSAYQGLMAAVTGANVIHSEGKEILTESENRAFERFFEAAGEFSCELNDGIMREIINIDQGIKSLDAQIEEAY